MFLREKKNKSGSVSVQIIQKSGGKYKVLQTIGNSRSEQEIAKLICMGKQQIAQLSQQKELFVFENDLQVEQMISNLSNGSIRTVGTEIIFGKIYDSIGFGTLNQELFRHLAIARIVYPLSKLKTVDYLCRYQGVTIDITIVYRFLDKLNDSLTHFAFILT